MPFQIIDTTPGRHIRRIVQQAKDNRMDTLLNDQLCARFEDTPSKTYRARLQCSEEIAPASFAVCLVYRFSLGMEKKVRAPNQGSVAFPNDTAIRQDNNRTDIRPAETLGRTAQCKLNAMAHVLLELGFVEWESAHACGEKEGV